MEWMDAEGPFELKRDVNVRGGLTNYHVSYALGSFPSHSTQLA